ncbi:NAD(P)-binding protein [Hypoxylon sp. NC1633]|nr:NAD(P)-binding protein [Hypoxylon sp. NC1633]
MSTAIRVAIVGATGRTGKSIVDGLIVSETNFEITALARPSSIDSAANNALKKRGIHVVAADLDGPKEDLVTILTGIDVVLSCIAYTHFAAQVPLAEAAKEAGVSRFVPSEWSTPTTRGVMHLHDEKDDVLAAIQRLGLPYTVIDVGWWAEHSVPAVPSGRTDHAVGLFNIFPGNGTVPCAYTDVPDVGTYAAKIIADPRTLNKKIFAYTDILTAKQIAELMEELSGEKVIQKHLSVDKNKQDVIAAKAVLEKDPTDFPSKLALALGEYFDC